MSNRPESVEKLISYQDDLKAQEDCLKKTIQRMNDQIHALQVEQLHILGSINKKQNDAPKPVKTAEAKVVHVTPKVIDPVSQQLNLSVRHYLSSSEDDDEMEDETM